MKKEQKKINNNFITFLFILICSIFVSIPLVKFNAQFDDGIQHIARLIETMKSIKQGGLLNVIMIGLCNGFGYSWNLFYSPLTAYMPLVLKIFGLSYGQILKVFMFLVSIASGYSMYFFMKKILKNRDIEDKRKNLISILAAGLYIMAPYRLNDMYIRVAVAELTSFIFIPIIFNGLYTIINQKQKSFILAWGVIGLILTHTLIAFYTAIFCIIYVIVNIKEIKLKQLLQLIYNVIIALLITSFYWVPLLESKLATNYEVFNINHMLRKDVLIQLKVKPMELLFIEHDRMAYFIGIPVIAGLLLIFFMIKNKKIQDKKNYYLFLIAGIVCIILTLNFIPFENFPNFMTMMQFSFRLLEFSTFFITVIASLNFGLSFKKFGIFPLIVIICVMADLLMLMIPNINFDVPSFNELDIIEGIPVTEQTGRVHAGCASFEYLPTKAFDNRSYIETREDNLVILSGKMEIKDYKKDDTNCSFDVQGSGIIELPYIYYIGYTAKINGEKVNITESDNGFCQIEINTLSSTLDKEENNFEKVEISYTGTVAMKVTLGISMISFIYLLLAEFRDRNSKVRK